MPVKADAETKEHNAVDGSQTRASTPELDEFGLPLRAPVRISDNEETEVAETADLRGSRNADTALQTDAESKDPYLPKPETALENGSHSPYASQSATIQVIVESEDQTQKDEVPEANRLGLQEGITGSKEVEYESSTARAMAVDSSRDAAIPDSTQHPPTPVTTGSRQEIRSTTVGSSKHKTQQSSATNGISEWSHQQQLVPHDVEEKVEEEDEWQTMPAFAPFDIYDDDNRLIAREHIEEEEDTDKGLGGAGKGYTRIQVDEDAQSATSLDENTSYLFKEINSTSAAGPDDDEQRDAVSQMQATKDLLTEGQRIAYVGLTRLAMSSMLKDVEALEGQSKSSKRVTAIAAEAMQMWCQKMMVRLYAHMDISAAEQVMIEQLSSHGVEPADMTPTLMQNARVRNPMAEYRPSSTFSSSRPGSVTSFDRPGTAFSSRPEEEVASPPPAYTEHEGEDLPEVRTPSQLPTTKNIDIDLRWTVLCDLFLVLIVDSVYDARSRVLLERVGAYLDVPWLEICRFEKRVTDALEMQQAAEKENWNEDEHKEVRRKMALKKRYVMMGLATVGGSLVIGLSAGLLAPVIGAGLAAGFTTIGVAGTSGFLAGAGGAAIITSTAAASGGVIGVRAANRRTGAVKTFEYRPLHNNKRVNLIITVSGWMTGKVDDVRLPYSTVDPIMGDIYSVLWEPEMLTSMGDTINILATEVYHLRIQIGMYILTIVGIDSGFTTSPWKYNSNWADGCSTIACGTHKTGISHR